MCAFLEIHKVLKVPIVLKDWLLDSIGEYEVKDTNTYLAVLN